MFGGTALVLAKLLHQIKLLLSYDRLMSILKDEPFFLWISHGLLVFVVLLVCSEVDRMTDVFGTVKNMADGFSNPAVQLSVLVTIIPTLYQSVGCRSRDIFLRENTGDLGRTVTVNTNRTCLQ